MKMKLMAVGIGLLIIIVGTARGQWLPDAESDKIRAMLKEKGVPAPTTLKFYNLPSMYQEMYTMNNGRTRVNIIKPWDQGEKLWTTSGGFHHVSRSEWRNITGLDLNGKSIEYWREFTNVGGFSEVPKHRWKFPNGTTAYDLLIRLNKGGSDSHLFEVRTRTKETDGKWDTGLTWRPDIRLAEKAAPDRYTWQLASRYQLMVPLNADVKTFELPTFGKDAMKMKFRPIKQLVVDADRKFVPPGYVGAGMKCLECHQHAGKVSSVAGKIYREAQPGDDTIHGWHPFRTDGTNDLNYDWPLVHAR